MIDTGPFFNQLIAFKYANTFGTCSLGSAFSFTPLFHRSGDENMRLITTETSVKFKWNRILSSHESCMSTNFFFFKSLKVKKKKESFVLYVVFNESTVFVVVESAERKEMNKR